MNYEAAKARRMNAIWNESTRVTNYQRYCKKWELEIILNDRINFSDKGKETSDYMVCKEWGWKEVVNPNELYNKPNNTDSVIDPIKEKEKAQEEAKARVIKKIEDYCLEKLHVVLNDRRGEATDEHYELCKSTIDSLRKTRVTLFMGRLGPALKLLKENIELGAQKV